MMTVNEVSKLAGVSIRTLQYYDKIGLLHPTGYTDAGYRLYDDADLERLQHILLFRELEFAVVLTVVLSVSTFFIIRNHIDSAKQNEVYDNLAEIVEDEPPKKNEGVTFSEDKDYLAEYLELYRQNEDMVGWIKIEDTNINYPVVQSVNEPNQYCSEVGQDRRTNGKDFY